MYLQNKYTRWYYNIIQQAQIRNTSNYTEKHHIIPKSLGGDNSKNNLVKLFPKEHFVCHRLLTKMTIGKAKDKMVFACWQLANQKNANQQTRTKINSNTYAILREEFSKVHSKRMRDNHPFNNPEIKEKHRLSIINRGPTSRKGIKRSEATVEKHRNKIWTDKAIKNRLTNCLKSAAKRKGIKNPDHGKKIFSNYVTNNIDIIRQIWELFDKGFNRSQISAQLNISWDRVNVAINRKEQILKLIHD